MSPAAPDLLRLLADIIVGVGLVMIALGVAMAADGLLLLIRRLHRRER